MDGKGNHLGNGHCIAWDRKCAIFVGHDNREAYFRIKKREFSLSIFPKKEFRFGIFGPFRNLLVDIASKRGSEYIE